MRQTLKHIGSALLDKKLLHVLFFFFFLLFIPYRLVLLSAFTCKTHNEFEAV